MAASSILDVYRRRHEDIRFKKSDFDHSCKIYNENAKGAVLFTGPDGIKDHKTKVLDPTFIGLTRKPSECTDNLFYIWRAARSSPHPRSKSKMVGEIGWNVTGNMDRRLLESREQIRLGEFRQACEDRYTHRNQSPWYPMRQRPKSDLGYRKQHAEASLLSEDLQQAKINKTISSRPASTIGSLPRYAWRNRPASPGSSSSGSVRTNSSFMRR